MQRDPRPRLGCLHPFSAGQGVRRMSADRELHSPQTILNVGEMNGVYVHRRGIVFQRKSNHPRYPGRRRLGSLGGERSKGNTELSWGTKRSGTSPGELGKKPGCTPRCEKANRGRGSYRRREWKAKGRKIGFGPRREAHTGQRGRIAGVIKAGSHWKNVDGHGGEAASTNERIKSHLLAVAEGGYG